MKERSAEMEEAKSNACIRIFVLKKFKAGVIFIAIKVIDGI